MIWFVRVAFAALALAACSPSTQGDKAKVSAEEQVRAEFSKIEKDKSAMGDLLGAMREGQSELYEKFIAIAAEEVDKGKTPFEAGAAARPIYMEKFVELVKTAEDDDINEMLEFTKLQMQHLLDMDPTLCAKAVNGEADPKMMKLPQDVLDREMRLMARVLRAGDQGAIAASEDVVRDWIDAYVAGHESMTEGLELMGTPGLSPADARKVCTANMTLLDGLLGEAPEVRAPLFRGLLGMS